jgi:hypothetical protein
VARAALWLLPLTAVSRAVTPGPTYLFGSDLVNPYGIEALAGVTWLTDTLARAGSGGADDCGSGEPGGTGVQRSAIPCLLAPRLGRQAR